MSAAEATVPFVPRSVSRVFDRTARWTLAAALVVGSVVVILHAQAFRQLEARLAGEVTGRVFAREVRVMTYEPVLAFERVAGDDGTWFALRITPDCSALYFLVPLALIAAFVLATGRSSVARIVLATLGAGLFLELLNIVRVEVMVLSIVRWGAEVFQWVHDTLGSALMLGGLTVALVLFFRLGFFGRRGRRTRGAHGEQP